MGALALTANTSGTNNTTIGYNAGSAVTTGTNLTIIGFNAAASSATATDEITLGNASVATLRCQVTTITALSDFRDKTDINNVDVGLSFVEKLRPVTFKWDKREWYTDGNRDGSKKDTITQVGFIAQELKQLQEQEGVEYLKLVYESNPEKLEATPGNLLIPLIKAVQELSVKVKTLEEEIMLLKQ
jgi:phosphodiesterase/alkaline phosphatase D-like protein